MTALTRPTPPRPTRGLGEASIRAGRTSDMASSDPSPEASARSSGGGSEPCASCNGVGVTGFGADAGGCDDCGGTGVDWSRPPPRPMRWTYRDDLFDDYLNAAVVDADGEPICSVDCYGDSDADDARARGLLIAAAPDLLAACRAMMAASDAYVDTPLDDPGRSDVDLMLAYGFALDAMRAAIAKAVPQQPRDQQSAGDKSREAKP